MPRNNIFPLDWFLSFYSVNANDSCIMGLDGHVMRLLDINWPFCVLFFVFGISSPQTFFSPKKTPGGRDMCWPPFGSNQVTILQTTRLFWPPTFRGFYSMNSGSCHLTSYNQQIIVMPCSIRVMCTAHLARHVTGCFLGRKYMEIHPLKNANIQSSESMKGDHMGLRMFSIGNSYFDSSWTYVLGGLYWWLVKPF